MEICISEPCSLSGIHGPPMTSSFLVWLMKRRSTPKAEGHSLTTECTSIGARRSGFHRLYLIVVGRSWFRVQMDIQVPETAHKHWSRHLGEAFGLLMPDGHDAREEQSSPTPSCCGPLGRFVWLLRTLCMGAASFFAKQQLDPKSIR